MDKWPLGVFTSVDAGLGLKLDVARELGLPTIQIHAPHAGSRTPEKAKELVDKLASFGIEATAMFGGFEGESYADIPTVVRTVG
ncbi:MAG: sugar phosphate isomerase/epimerase, partial [Pirellulales bacterium]|nr:sugar phosphate isomerase/epimerase [Pirellulales bacterium]